MDSTLDKIRKLKASRPQGGSGNRFRGVFHQWKDNDNVIRLAGEFLEVRTHFIAPAPKRNDRGLCRPDVFQGDNSIPSFVNCLDWDVQLEEVKKVKTCPVCRLSNIAWQILKDPSINEQEKKFFKALASSAFAKRNLKWNILDREDPYVILVDDGGEKRVLGFKIATIGMEAWNDIEGIFEQCGFDIADPEQGIDIKVIKGNNGTRVVYSAQAILAGKELKVTPFTDEEKALEFHDLKVRCGKMVEAQRIMDAFHEDLRELIEMNDDDKVLEKEAEAATESVAEVETVAEEAPVEDGDGLMDGTSAPAPQPKPAAPAAQRPAAPVRPATPVAPKPAIPVRPTAPVAQKPATPVPQRPAATVPQRPATPAAQKPAATLPPRPATTVPQRPATAPAIRRPVTTAVSEAQKKR